MFPTIAACNPGQEVCTCIYIGPRAQRQALMWPTLLWLVKANHATHWKRLRSWASDCLVNRHAFQLACDLAVWHQSSMDWPARMQCFMLSGCHVNAVASAEGNLMPLRRHSWVGQASYEADPEMSGPYSAAVAQHRKHWHRDWRRGTQCLPSMGCPTQSHLRQLHPAA